MPKKTRKGEQIGETTTAWDMNFQALKPGKRKSKKRKTYYEHRKNRTDIGRWV